LEDLGVGERTILEWSIKKYVYKHFRNQGIKYEECN